MGGAVDRADPDAGARSGAGAHTPHHPALPGWDAIAVQALRDREFARLDAAGLAYLDYTGGGLYAASQLAAHHALLRDGILGNPHSTNHASQRSTRLTAMTRQAVLDWFGADPDTWTVIFTPNASGALRLVGEAYPFGPGGRLLLTADNHNSVNGLREFARRAGAEVTYLHLTTPELRVDAEVVTDALTTPAAGGGLFAFPAQSNFSGVQHPLEWIETAHANGWDVLLDAAAFAPSNRLDLGRWQPDFVALSWYKLFGYPTGIGALIARREALGRLQRPWFAGGAIDVASVVLMRHTMADAEAGFEDGTVDYLAIPAVGMGLDFLRSVGIETIHARVTHLTDRLLRGLAGLRHRDGTPLVVVYGPAGLDRRGGTVTFDVLDRTGRAVDVEEVEATADRQGVLVRTGCFCNPGASEAARGITADEVARIYALGPNPSHREMRAVLGDKPPASVRASMGVATVERDVDRLVEVIAGYAG